MWDRIFLHSNSPASQWAPVFLFLLELLRRASDALKQETRFSELIQRLVNMPFRELCRGSGACSTIEEARRWGEGGGDANEYHVLKEMRKIVAREIRVCVRACDICFEDCPPGSRVGVMVIFLQKVGAVRLVGFVAGPSDSGWSLAAGSSCVWTKPGNRYVFARFRTKPYGMRPPTCALLDLPCSPRS